MGPRFLVRVIHTPTGRQVEISSRAVRSYQAAIRTAKHVLRSKVWAAQNNLTKDEIVASYDLPDDMPYPPELEVFRHDNSQRA